ncbi:Uma2 family endonuclease [Streptomyces cavernicola]|uniref:Uma2 family endonuclease n=1 Tax=Streptomyces cavernicola TaxID=3043613 RepID=A0ABT6SIV6_9ACTN|nr:Uma2 family endonuclease [Streptomyces sp. B-S-A6]MDI3407824.1 Uma2 family endonuclease [Streptomyces sp. B-S-A6]
MTVMAERTPQTSPLSVEEFERIADFAAKDSDNAVKLEFIDGRIEVKDVPDGDHGTIVTWLIRRCMQHRPELDVYADQGLRGESYRRGRARPDAVLVPEAYFAGHGEWADPDGVLMTVEITSHDSDTDRRDRKEKPLAYAAAGIPVHLLIDRDEGTLIVHSNPDAEAGRYQDIHIAKFGDSVHLPDPVSFALETERLRDFVR